MVWKEGLENTTYHITCDRISTYRNRKRTLKSQNAYTVLYADDLVTLFSFL